MPIEKALPEDHQELTALMRRSKSFWKYDAQQLERWRGELTISADFIRQHPVFKLVDSEVIQGFYSYSIFEKTLELDNLFVLPEYIGQKIGKQLMDDFLDKAQQLAVDTVVLDADPNAEGFYRRFGFQTVSLKVTSIPKRFLPIMMKHLKVREEEETSLFMTDRLLVRPLVREDLDDFYDMQRNPKVMQFIKPPMDYEQSKQELERFIGYYDRRDLFYRIWAVTEKASGTLVGICGVYLNEQQEHEIAYRLREEYWGKGLGSEMANGLINYCFTILQYDELVAYISKGNIGSAKIARRLMNVEKEFYSKKDRGMEQVYRLQRDTWLPPTSREHY